jgi:23S rRNA-/tRNA-specific pseudouridylate synthase
MAASYRRGFRRRKEGGMVRRMVSTLTVTEDEADIRLDRWFRRHFPGVTQGAIQKLCRTGQVRVDGRRADAATRLAAGQSVRVPPLPAPPPPRPEPPPVDDASRSELEGLVLYRDDHLIVCVILTWRREALRVLDFSKRREV